MSRKSERIKTALRQLYRLEKRRKAAPNPRLEEKIAKKEAALQALEKVEADLIDRRFQAKYGGWIRRSQALMEYAKELLR